MSTSTDNAIRTAGALVGAGLALGQLGGGVASPLSEAL
jgi:hypothetical protein